MTKHYTPAEAEKLLEDTECPRCVGTGSVGGEQITRDHFPTQVSDCESCGGSGSQNPLFGVARQCIEQARELERVKALLANATGIAIAPIESAPRVGTWFLYEYAGERGLAQHCPECGHLIDEEGDSMPSRPSYWMPPPEPPK